MYQNIERSDRRKIRFLSVSLISEQKGLIYLLKAAENLIRRRYTAFELVIGGDGPGRIEIERMAEGMGLRKYCHFLGLLTPAEVRHWMQRSDVFVLPSLHETFGMVLGEAMACGKPVISTRCGGPEFVVTPETGILVDVADPMALADAMEGFITGRHQFDPCLLRESIIERFGEKSFLANISKIYDEVLERYKQ